MYNRSRGKDSCGYYWNGNIEKGVDTYGKDSVKQADFADFYTQRGLNKGNLKMTGDVFLDTPEKLPLGRIQLKMLILFRWAIIFKFIMELFQI